MSTSIQDILISELDRAVVPATGKDELVLNQIDDGSGSFVTRRINWQEVGQSIQDLSGDPNFPGVKQILFDDGEEGQPSITFKNDDATGIYRQDMGGVASVAFTVKGLEALRAVGGGTALRSVGIGFSNNDPNLPEQALHIKNGGLKIQFSDNRLSDNIIEINSTNGQAAGAGQPWINTHQRIHFSVNNDAVFTISKSAKFDLYKPLGVSIGYTGVPFYGDPGWLFTSGGPTAKPNWTSPTEFIQNNLDIIVDNLLLDPGFISGIGGVGSGSEPGYGLENNQRVDSSGDLITYLDNTFVFADHLPSI